MPHIVFDKKIDLKLLIEKFSPISLKKDKSLIKIQDMYINDKNWTALFYVIVVDDVSQNYFIELSTRESKTTIRLFPLTDPEKTDSVKKSLVLVYEFIHHIQPEISITKTNLQEYLSNRSLTC